MMTRSINQMLAALCAAYVALATLGCTVTVTSTGGGRTSSTLEPGPDTAPPGDDGTASGDQTASSDEWEPADIEGPPQVDFTETEATTATSTIPAATGGSVTASGKVTARLDIPANTLAADTEVSLTLLPGPADDPYAVAALVDTQGLELAEPASLVITLDPPLPAGESLRVLDMPTGDPAAYVDTGLLADISADRTQAIIPIEAFAATGTAAGPRQGTGGDAAIRRGGKAVTRNCHGHTLRRIVQGLLAEGKDANTIYNEVSAANQGHLTADELQKLQQQINLSAQGVHCFTSDRALEVVLSTYYRLETVSRNVNGQTGSSGSVTLENVDQRCIADMANFAGRSKLPPVILQGPRFTIGGNPDTDPAAGGPTGFYDKIPHSTPVVRRGNQLWIENGLAVSDADAEHLRQLREARGEDASLGAVIPVEFSQLNTTQRNQRSGEAWENERNRLGDNFHYSRPLEKRNRPWISQRWYFPKPLDGAGQQTQANICSEDDVEVLQPGYEIFRITNYHSQPDGYFTILLETALDDPPLLSGYPGGGLDPELRAELTPLNGDVFDTPEEAAASICSGFTEFFRPALASFILAGVWNGQYVGVDGVFQSVCEQ